MKSFKNHFKQKKLSKKIRINIFISLVIAFAVRGSMSADNFINGNAEPLFEINIERKESIFEGIIFINGREVMYDLKNCDVLKIYKRAGEFYRSFIPGEIG